MRIAQVAPPFETVPPSRYGGTELVVATLTNELVRRGHDVTLFAAGDSRTSARLVPVVDSALWHHDPPYQDFAPFWAVVLDVLVDCWHEFDVIHSHLDYLAFPLARFAPCPLVTTLHGRLDLPELECLYGRFNDIPIVSISDAQRQPVPHANWVATAHHGVEVEEYTFDPVGGEYLAFLGRISPEKGLETAIAAARKSGLPLKVAAREPLPHDGDPSAQRDWEYYEREIRPLLKAGDVEMIGPVRHADKNRLLGGAAALLFPIRWPEPFGLVMVEALACGTPVLAFNNGSVPEVLQHGVTGFICDSEDELVKNASRIRQIDRMRCRAEAEQRFSAEAMANQYERVYDSLLADAGPRAARRVV